MCAELNSSSFVHSLEDNQGWPRTSSADSLFCTFVTSVSRDPTYHFRNQVNLNRVDVFVARKAILPNDDLVVELLHVVRLEGNNSESQQIQKNPQRPNVTFKGHFSLGLDDFRRQISRCSSCVEDLLSALDQVGNAEVADFGFEVGVEEDVVEFDVPVDHVVLVQVVHSGD